MSNYHVTKDPKGWNVRKEGSERASKTFRTKREAEVEAKRFARNSGGGEVRIHGENGRIRDSDTVKPAKDPFPPRDRRH